MRGHLFAQTCYLVLGIDQEHVLRGVCTWRRKEWCSHVAISTGFAPTAGVGAAPARANGSVGYSSTRGPIVPTLRKNPTINSVASGPVGAV